VWPFTMWVADDGRVLMVKGDPPRLDIRSPAGIVLSSVDLPADMLFPLHAVEMSEKRATTDSCMKNEVSCVVSHGRTDDHLHRVCKVVLCCHLLTRLYGAVTNTTRLQYRIGSVPKPST